MKKFAILLGLTASFLLMTGCANKTAPDQNMVAADNGTAAHQDYKGEVSKVKVKAQKKNKN